MALGKRRDKQQELLIPTTQLPRSPGHPFYRSLNRLLSAAEFDRFAEELCAPHYADRHGPELDSGTVTRRADRASLSNLPQEDNAISLPANYPWLQVANRATETII